jgi:hypothetical protein
VEEDQPTHVSDEAYPAIIRNLFSPPATINRVVNMWHEPGAVKPTTLKPVIVAHSENADQANAGDDSVTPNDNRNMFPVSDIPPTTGSRQVFKRQVKADPNISTAPGTQSRYVNENRISPGTLSPFQQQISRQQETTQKNTTGNQGRESLDYSARELSTPDIINVKEKPIATSVRQIKPVSPTNKPDIHLSKEVPANSDTGSYRIADTGQVSISKEQHSTDTISKQDSPSINRADLKKSGQLSIPGTVSKPGKQPLKSSPVEKVELSGGISDDGKVDSLPVLSEKKSISLKPEATSKTTSEQNNHIVDKTISKIADQSSVQLLPDKLNTWPSISLPLNKTVSPEEVTDRYRDESHPANLNTASDQEASLRTDLFTDTQVTNIKRPQTKKPTRTHSTEFIQRTHQATRTPENTNTYIYEHDETNMIISQQDRIDEGPVKINMSNPLLLRPHIPDLNLRTHPSIGNTSSRIAPISQRVLRSKINKPSSETNEKGFDIRDTENVSSYLGYWQSNQQSLNLPVVSTLLPKVDPGLDHSEDLYRTVSEKLPEMTRPRAYTAPDLALVPAARAAEPASAGQTIINQQQIENRNDQAAAPNIRIIADQVYALLRRELKIERERERHRLLR